MYFVGIFLGILLFIFDKLYSIVDCIKVFFYLMSILMFIRFYLLGIVFRSRKLF